MKKLIFLGSLVLVAACFVLRLPFAALGLGLVLVGWLIAETWQRQRPHFLAKPINRVFRESTFPFSGELFALLASGDGEKVLLVGVDGIAKLFAASPRPTLLWETKLETKPMALALSYDGSHVYLAFEHKIAGLDQTGRIFGEISFRAPEQGAQSYKLHTTRAGKLLFHTPWFVQEVDPQLSWLGPRLESSQVGNFIKYLKISDDASRLFIGGALMLEDYVGVQARYACWRKEKEGYSLVWQREDKSQENSHLRSIDLSLDGGVVSVQSHSGNYQFSLLTAAGEELWARQGEDPALSDNGDLVLWNSPFEGLTLSRVKDKERLWVRKPEAKLRLKQLYSDGSSLVLEGRHLLCLSPEGKVAADAWFHTDPHDLVLTRDGRRMVVLRQAHCALIEISRP